MGETFVVEKHILVTHELKTSVCKQINAWHILRFFARLLSHTFLVMSVWFFQGLNQ